MWSCVYHIISACTQIPVGGVSVWGSPVNSSVTGLTGIPGACCRAQPANTALINRIPVHLYVELNVILEHFECSFSVKLTTTIPTVICILIKSPPPPPLTAVWFYTLKISFLLLLLPTVSRRVIKVQSQKTCYRLLCVSGFKLLFNIVVFDWASVRTN